MKIETAAARCRWFEYVALQPLPIDVECKAWKRKRSDEQNRYLWGVCYATLRDATGQDCDDWHEFFLGEWSGWETVELFGKRRLKPLRRSSKLSTIEFAEYVGFIQRRAAENGIFIPDPEPT